MSKKGPTGEIAVVLHNIRSLHNVGSIFRTADAAGVKKIYICGITPSPFDRFGKLRPQFGKVSLGAESFVDWEKAGNAASLLRKLRNEGYKIFPVEQSAKSVPYFRFPQSTKRNVKICLVFGNEIRGLPSSILKISDRILEIPMFGKKESLNVAVAFGVVIFHIVNSVGKVV